MLFNTFEYIVFLVFLSVIFYRLDKTGRTWLLLVSSYVFYAVWSVQFCVLLLLNSLWTYVFGLYIEETEQKSRRKRLLFVSLAGPLSILFYFKYTNFAIDALSTSLLAIGKPGTFDTLTIILPLGISFYTFQSMSYVIDVYRKDIEACRNPVDLLTYISFFPQLVAGPIERAGHILPQLEAPKKIRFDQINSGVNMILWGLFKKVVLADNLATYVDMVYAAPQKFSSIDAVLGTYAFAFQIYFDFSAYSHIAYGSALLFGIRLSKNFETPYFSYSIRDFWRRWHITFSNWLRDYIYIPLGGSRVASHWIYGNLLITMFLGGLWHGANWTFVIWGLFHGLLLAVTRMMDVGFGFESIVKRNKIIKFFAIAVTFQLVCVGWVFFRADSIETAFTVFKTIGALSTENLSTMSFPVFILLSAIVLANVAYYFFKPYLLDAAWHPAVSSGTVYRLAVLVVMVLAGSISNKFIYFEF